MPTESQPPTPAREDTDELPVTEDPSFRGRRSRTGRMLVWAGAVLGVLLLVLLAANEIIANRMAAEAEAQLEEALGAPTTVQLHGWPVGLRVLAGEVPRASVRATDVPIEGTSAVLRRLDVNLREVALGRGAPDAVLLRAEEATFEAELDAEAVQGLLGIVGRIPLTEIELRSGVVRLRFAGFAVVDATVQIEDGLVVLRPTAPLADLVRIELQVGDLPLGFEIEDAQPGRGVLRLEGGAAPMVIPDDVRR